MRTEKTSIPEYSPAVNSKFLAKNCHQVSSFVFKVFSSFFIYLNSKLLVCGDPLEILKISDKKFKMRFLNSVTVPNNVKWGLLGFFDIHCVAKYRNKRRGTLWCNPKNLKKVTMPKKILMKKILMKKNPNEKHQDSKSIFSRLWKSVLFFVLARF